jgi:cardiolipin synthase
MLNLPNLISLARIILIPFFILFLIREQYSAAFWIFIIAAVSDAIDGIFARRLNQRTSLGAYLDPTADKLLAASAFITLAMMEFIPIWLLLMVIGRDMMIGLGVLYIFWRKKGRFEIRPLLLSKVNTWFQFSTIVSVLLILYPTGLPPVVKTISIGGAAITTVGSGIQYVARGIQILRQG